MLSPRRLTVSALSVAALLALAACATKPEQTGATAAPTAKDQYVTTDPEIGSRIKKRTKKGEARDKSGQIKTFSGEALQDVRPDVAQTAERASGMTTPGN
jgi:type IV pilus biogenesis protein CpaD/CtpE